MRIARTMSHPNTRSHVASRRAFASSASLRGFTPDFPRHQQRQALRVHEEMHRRALHLGAPEDREPLDADDGGVVALAHRAVVVGLERRGGGSHEILSFLIVRIVSRL